MNPMIPKRTRRLRARAATMNTHDEEYEDYGPEPNMKLSHAFIVVLLLHVIAVGGLYTFNSMKASKAPKYAAAKTSAPVGESVEPTHRETPSNPEPPKPEEPKNQSPKMEGQGSGGGKSPLFAKKVETPKVSEKSTTPASKGFLASMRSAVAKATGVGVVAGGASHAAAQDASNAPVVDSNGSPSSVVAGKTYIVKAGDTMTKIASSLGVSISNLEKANGLMKNAVLQVGQTLKVPEQAITQAAADVSGEASKVVQGVQQLPGSIASASSSMTNAKSVDEKASAANIVAEYTVVKGDSPYKIAKKFKITPDELMKANGITDPKKIQIGQKLNIPASSKKASK